MSFNKNIEISCDVVDECIIGCRQFGAIVCFHSESINIVFAEFRDWPYRHVSDVYRPILVKSNDNIAFLDEKEEPSHNWVHFVSYRCIQCIKRHKSRFTLFTTRGKIHLDCPSYGVVRELEAVLDHRQKSMQIGEGESRGGRGRTTKRCRKMFQLFCRVTDADITYYVGKYMYNLFRMSAAIDQQLPKFWINRNFFFAALGPVADLDTVFDRAMLLIVREIKAAYTKNVKRIRQRLNDKVSSDRAVIEKLFSNEFGAISHQDDCERNRPISQSRSSSSGSLSSIIFLFVFILILLLFLFFGHK